MDETEKDYRDIMASHWVDTARGEDLDSLGAVYSLKRKTGEPEPGLQGPAEDLDHQLQGRRHAGIPVHDGADRHGASG